MTKTALLVLDIQNGIVERLDDHDTYLARLAPAIKVARESGIKVIYVKTAFREGYPDTHPRSTMGTRVRESQSFREGDIAVEIPSVVAPNANEPIITKRRVSAFTATDLDLVLRCLGAEHLVVVGLVTSGAVLSTVRQAADLDYQLTVLEDLCMDRDQEVHDVLMKKVLSRQAQVVSSAEWMAELDDESGERTGRQSDKIVQCQARESGSSEGKIRWRERNSSGPVE